MCVYVCVKGQVMCICGVKGQVLCVYMCVKDQAPVCRRRCAWSYGGIWRARGSGERYVCVMIGKCMKGEIHEGARVYVCAKYQVMCMRPGVSGGIQGFAMHVAAERDVCVCG